MQCLGYILCSMCSVLLDGPSDISPFPMYYIFIHSTVGGAIANIDSDTMVRNVCLKIMMILYSIQSL